MSENEDIDYERAITDMITQESIHNAALSVGVQNYPSNVSRLFMITIKSVWTSCSYAFFKG